MNASASGSARDYSSISPSARVLLLMKGLTPIPYAREAAALMSASAPDEHHEAKQEPGFWGRVAHFEARYQSISTLLNRLDVTNVLELSSGFSFRGLDWVQHHAGHYIDTDLPGIIEQKQLFTEKLQQQHSESKGKLETLPLNALDEAAFREVVARFPEGKLAIVNEGLLMYLGIAEKEKLCRIIRSVLQERGGCWITADIYIQSKQGTPSIRVDDELQRFLDEHHIEDNKFESFEAAEAFFKRNGLAIGREAEPDYRSTSAIHHLLEHITPEQREKMQQATRIHTTWQLEVVE